MGRSKAQRYATSAEILTQAAVREAREQTESSDSAEQTRSVDALRRLRLDDTEYTHQEKKQDPKKIENNVGKSHQRAYHYVGDKG